MPRATSGGGVGPPIPPALLRVAADWTWRAHLQPTDPGWLDLALALPLLDTGRLRGLGWQPRHSGPEVLQSFLDALQSRTGGSGPLLRPGRT